MKLVEEGPNADLSMYSAPIQPQIINQPESPVRMNRAKMLFIINGSLKMGKGKICAQVGHAVIGAYLQIEQMAKYD